MDGKELADAFALVTAAGGVAVDTRARVKAAKSEKSDGGAKVTLAEAEAIAEEELRRLKAPLLALVRDLVG